MFNRAAIVDALNDLGVAQARHQTGAFAECAVHRELHAKVLRGLRNADVVHHAMLGFEEAVDFRDHVFGGLPCRFVGEIEDFKIEGIFDAAERVENQEHDQRGEDGGDVEAAADGHSNRGDDEEGGSGGEAADQTSGMQDGTGADEPNTGNDLGRNAGGFVAAGEFMGKQREHGRAETDEHVGAETGGTVLEFPFQADDAAEQRG